MHQSNSDIRITGIDAEHNTVHLSVNGYSVTAVCAEKENTEVYDNIRRILIGTLADAYRKGLTIFDKKPQT